MNGGTSVPNFIHVIFLPVTIAEAIPENFDRFKKGDALIAQELNRLLLLDQQHHETRPLLTEGGRVRLRNASTNQVEIGASWNEILARAPGYFSRKYPRLRSKTEYGTAVHGDFVRIAKQLSRPPHLRVAPQ